MTGSASDRLAALAGDMHTAALKARMAVEGDGAGPSPIELAALAGQLRGKLANSPPFGCDGEVWRAFLVCGRALCDGAIERGHAASVLDSLVITSREIGAAARAQRGDGFAEAIAQSRKDVVE